MAKIKMVEIVNACLDGIETSYIEYLKWSCHDEWLWRAPEYLLTVNVAKKIWKIEGSKHITLEDNIKETLKSAKAKVKGSLSQYIRANGRADIVLWWGSKCTPRAIIEVKHRVYKFANIQEDLDRIIELLKKESDLQFAISTFYMDYNYKKGQAEKKLEQKILKLFEDTQEYLSNYSKGLKSEIHYNFTSEDDKDVWGSVVILIKR